jgi:hypothetical protein
LLVVTAAHGALNTAVNLHVERGQDVTVSLELNEELLQDDAGKEEMKRQFIAEIAEALGVPVEMLVDVEFIDSGEEQQRVVAREWLTQVLTESVRCAAATMGEWEDAASRRKEARATAALLEASDGAAPVRTNKRMKKAAASRFKTAAAKVSTAIRPGKKTARAKTKHTTEERLHLKTVRALAALGGDNDGMHSMLVGARGKAWCDMGLCVWCQRPEGDPLRGLCSGIEEEKRQEQRDWSSQSAAAGVSGGTEASAGMEMVAPLVEVSCSSLHVKFSQVEMKVGVQAWADRVFEYDTIPAELLPATLIRGESTKNLPLLESPVASDLWAGLDMTDRLRLQDRIASRAA